MKVATQLPEGGARRRLAIAAILYALCTLIFLSCAGQDTLREHTPYNHFALLADAFRHGRLDLGGAPPPYTGNNDFARYGGKWFVVFPPFPALLLLPLTALRGGAERVRDGQFFLWLAGLTPALLFLGLEKLRRFGRAATRERDSVVLSVLFAFGTVYFFSAEQGTVWFAAHTVGAALAALYLLCALEAERPFWAGLALGLGFATRSPLLFAFPLFLLELLRVATRDGDAWASGSVSRIAGALDYKRVVRALLLFALPVACVLAASFVYNQKRFGSPFEVGYRFLGVVWQQRIEKWGLFSYHYLGKNLGVCLTDLPFRNPDGSWQINEHGLALWLTTPLYLWLIWPRRRSAPQLALWLTVLAVALPTLLYQNTGWLQFGYRFSNDYSVFLFALFATGGYRFGKLFKLAAVWALAVNAFGALSFNRAGYEKYYFQDNTQRILHQPD